MIDMIFDIAAKYVIQEMIGILIGATAILWRQICKIHKEMEAIRGGVRGNLRMQIKQEAKIHLEDGNISIDDRKVLDELFEEYFALNGNGPVKILKGEIDKLPTKINTED